MSAGRRTIPQPLRKSDKASQEDFVSVKCTDSFRTVSSTQHWPVSAGKWKALVMLSPGANHLIFDLHHANTLMLPSSKFRTTAYMWQALTAEDMREKGLGRRSIRLEEEWSINTTAQQSHRFPNSPDSMGTIAKIHIVRTEKTVAELRDRRYAQQNSNARKPDALHQFFEDALKAYGGPFASNNRPVVAGLILDSSYSIESDMIHAHAALGCHKSDGLSLGIFGSHLTYSWPRFFDEIPACLLDGRPTDDTVGNDNGECNSLREACFVGQGAFLHEVGHAFGADHTTGIMARGYSKHWPRSFLAQTETENNAKWDLQDVLRFKNIPHFKLPEDEPRSNATLQATVDITPFFNEGKQGITITSFAGLARVVISYEGKTKTMELMDWKNPCTIYSIPDIDQEYDRSNSLNMTILGMNGKQRVVKEVWRLLKQTSFVRIPGCDIVLRKQSVKSERLENNEDDDKFCEWAMLLHEKGADGKLYHASAIDLRVGCTLAGAVVYYADGHRTNCGRAGQRSFGGHARKKQALTVKDSIVKVEIRRAESYRGSLDGIRMTLDNGTQWGELHDFDSEDYYEKDGETVVLEPADGERIVGFFGQSDNSNGFCCEFGIIIAPKDRDLPAGVYDIRELKNRVEDVVTPGSESDGEE